MNESFVLTPVDDGSRRLAGGWLKLGIAALLVAGVYALLLAVARTPYVKDIFPGGDFFKVSLVVHVVFSNVCWFLAIAGMVWNMNSRDRAVPLGRLALAVTSMGVIIVAVSPFAGAGTPVMANYVPFLDHPLFFAGLAVAGLGLALLVIRTLVAIPPLALRRPSGAVRFGVYAAANAAAMAVIAFVWAALAMRGTFAGAAYYEMLFWVGGHVLQFTHTVLLLVAWVWLASASGVALKLTPRLAVLSFTLALFVVAFVPAAFLSMEVASGEFHSWFTRHMLIGGAVASVPLGLAVLWSLFGAGRAPHDGRPLRIALYLSMLLYAVGGVFGYLLQGSSTLVTAHYHAVTGAVTLAFMAVVYQALPQLGFGRAGLRLQGAQVYAYGVGQLLHVLGLAWAGGYGMQRKVGGSEQAMDNLQQTLGMALMGMGGGVATIGGILFLIAVVTAMRRPKP